MIESKLKAKTAVSTRLGLTSAVKQPKKKTTSTKANCGTQIQMFADWSTSHAQRVTVNRQKSGISYRCRDKEIVDKQQLSCREYMTNTMINKNRQRFFEKNVDILTTSK